MKQVKEKKVLLSHSQPFLNKEGSVLTPALNSRVMTLISIGGFWRKVEGHLL